MTYIEVQVVSEPAPACSGTAKSGTNYLQYREHSDKYARRSTQTNKQLAPRCRGKGNIASRTSPYERSPSLPKLAPDHLDWTRFAVNHNEAVTRRARRERRARACSLCVYETIDAPQPPGSAAAHVRTQACSKKKSIRPAVSYIKQYVCNVSGNFNAGPLCQLQAAPRSEADLWLSGNIAFFSFFYPNFFSLNLTLHQVHGQQVAGLRVTSTYRGWQATQLARSQRR